MDGTYEDSSCKTKTGKFYFFHSNSVLSSTGNYIHGKKEGLWLSFHSNGVMSDSTVYSKGKQVGTSLSWHENGIIADSTIIDEAGTGISVSWFDNGNPSSSGRLVNRKGDGNWQFFHKNGKLSALETYKNGVQVDKKYFDEQGNSMADTTSKDKEATMVNGLKGWQKYLTKAVYFPEGYKIVNADKAVVVVSFTVNNEGVVTNVFADTPLAPEFDRIAINAVKKSPKWSPAISHNRRVDYKARQAIFFTQEVE